MPGPRPIRFTALEVAALLALYEIARSAPADMPKGSTQAVLKLQAALEPAPKGASVAPLEAALEKAAPGKVARLLSSGYARASKRAAQLQVTADDVTLVGRWLAPWYRGTVTLLDVLNRWDTWLPKARLSVPPKGLPEGLDGGSKADVGPRTEAGGRPPTPGRPQAGFR